MYGPVGRRPRTQDPATRLAGARRNARRAAWILFTVLGGWASLPEPAAPQASPTLMVRRPPAWEIGGPEGDPVIAPATTGGSDFRLAAGDRGRAGSGMADSIGRGRIFFGSVIVGFFAGAAGGLAGAYAADASSDDEWAALHGFVVGAPVGASLGGVLAAHTLSGTDESVWPLLGTSVAAGLLLGLAAPEIGIVIPMVAIPVAVSSFSADQ